jgi:dipeptidyl-peptidase 4
MAHPIGHKAFDTYYNDLGETITGLRVIPAWTPDGKAVAFTTGGADDRQAWRVSLDDGSREPLVDVAKARHAIEQALGFQPSGRGLPFEHFAFVGANA